MTESNFVKSPAERAAAYLIDLANRIHEGREKRLIATFKKIPNLDSFSRVRDQVWHMALPIIYAKAKHELGGFAASRLETLGGVIAYLANIVTVSAEPVKAVYSEANARAKSRKAKRRTTR